MTNTKGGNMTTDSGKEWEKTIKKIVWELMVEGAIGNVSPKRRIGYIKALIGLINSVLTKHDEELLKRITPALDDLSAAANLMIKSNVFEKTGQEIHEDIGYIKSCLTTITILSQLDEKEKE